MQLEFEFTWFHFCELVDKETGEVYYPVFEELEEFENAPFTSRCAA